jgi:hypothetical protein
MEQLIHYSNTRSLKPLEETELRDLVAKERPNAANNPIDDLIKAALIIIGFYILYKILESETEQY